MPRWALLVLATLLAEALPSAAEALDDLAMDVDLSKLLSAAGLASAEPKVRGKAMNTTFMHRYAYRHSYTFSCAHTDAQIR
jgi:hypothetical protein